MCAYVHSHTHTHTIEKQKTQGPGILETAGRCVNSGYKESLRLMSPEDFVLSFKIQSGGGGAMIAAW